MSDALPVIAIRPQPGCDATVALARGMGLDVQAHPLFAVAPRAWEPPAASTFDALLLGSANALRHAGPGLAGYPGKPAYAVGAETARAAADAGLLVVATGSGGLQQVLGSLAPEHRRLLRLAGEARVTLTPPPGITIEDRVVYASEPLPMTAELAAILAPGALVLLHSAEAARHFARECARVAVDRSIIALAVLAPAIAAAAGEGWAALRMAEFPTDPALLASAADLWHMPATMRGSAKAT